MIGIKVRIEIAIILIVFATLVGATEKDLELMDKVSLTLEIEKTKINRSGGTLHFLITLNNLSGENLQLVSVEGQVPYSVLVWDQSGKNLNVIANTEIVKDRTQKEKLSLLAKKSIKQFRLDFNLKDVLEKHSVFVSGRFDIEVSYPLIKFVDGTYKSKIIHSERVTVTVTD